MTVDEPMFKITRTVNPHLLRAKLAGAQEFWCPECKVVHHRTPLMYQQRLERECVWTCTCGEILQVPKASY
jgi:nonstructural protein NSm